MTSAFPVRALRAGAMALLAAALAVTGPALVMRFVAPVGTGFQARSGEPPAGDFLVFYAAGQVAAAGGDPYDLSRLAATAATHTTAPNLNTAPFAYPPPILTPLAALARAPPALALWLWVAASAGAAAVAAWIATRQIAPALAALGFPGLGVVLACGQTSAFAPPCAAIIARGIDNRPAVAGAALGLMAVKPQLALGIGVLLALDGRWRALAAATAVAGALALLALAIEGVAPWRAFAAALTDQAARTADKHLPLTRMVTPFALFRVTGASTGVALIGHATVAAFAFAALHRLWRAEAPAARPLAVALAPAFASPYLFDYDLAALVTPFAVMLAQSPTDRPGRRLVWLALLGAAMPVVLLSSLYAKAALGAVVTVGLLWTAVYGPWRLAPSAPAAPTAWPFGRTRAKGA